METAAARVVEMVLVSGTWDCPVGYEHMRGSYEQNGFLWLIHGEMLIPNWLTGGWKGHWYVSNEMLDRISHVVKSEVGRLFPSELPRTERLRVSTTKET